MPSEDLPSIQPLPVSQSGSEEEDHSSSRAANSQGSDEAPMSALIPQESQWESPGPPAKQQPHAAAAVLKGGPKTNHTFDTIDLSPEDRLNESLESAGNRIVTLTGTIKRGEMAGQMVEVQMELTKQDMKKLNHSVDEDDKQGDCIWGVRKGIHIFLFTVICMPFALIASLCVSFYIGSIAWYNVYLYLSEERTIWHKIFICPFLILFYPVLVGVTSIGIGIYAAFIQLSWYFSSWYKEFRDFEKGFFGFVCNTINLPQCSPYEIILLDEDLSSMKDERKKIAQTAV